MKAGGTLEPHHVVSKVSETNDLLENTATGSVYVLPIITAYCERREYKLLRGAMHCFTNAKLFPLHKRKSCTYTTDKLGGTVSAWKRWGGVSRLINRFGYRDCTF
ncbi:hypothetical protein VNO77_44593 [Canavalia gladiata]|uniref:Uncharacterized protein n=1 Tax=Canavalia gladiata TaxID=3824 RepID=A0AAN9JYC8_CANGL